MDFSPYFLCSGASAMSVIIVVQFGFAMMFLGMDLAASGLISGTMSGTSGSMRKADELSITMQPAFAAEGANSREIPPPAEKRAISTPSKLSCVSSWMVISSPQKFLVCPADLAEASSVSLLIGNFLSARQLSISSPTAPVAPTIAICLCWLMLFGLVLGAYLKNSKWQSLDYLFILVLIYSKKTLNLVPLIMGQQHNKVLKRKRRKEYLRRKKIIDNANSGEKKVKPAVKKVAAKKAAPAKKAAVKKVAAKKAPAKKVAAKKVAPAKKAAKKAEEGEK